MRKLILLLLTLSLLLLTYSFAFYLLTVNRLKKIFTICAYTIALRFFILLSLLTFKVTLVAARSAEFIQDS